MLNIQTHSNSTCIVWQTRNHNAACTNTYIEDSEYSNVTHVLGIKSDRIWKRSAPSLPTSKVPLVLCTNLKSIIVGRLPTAILRLYYRRGVLSPDQCRICGSLAPAPTLTCAQIGAGASTLADSGRCTPEKHSQHGVRLPASLDALLLKNGRAAAPQLHL